MLPSATGAAKGTSDRHPSVDGVLRSYGIHSGIQVSGEDTPVYGIPEDHSEGPENLHGGRLGNL